MWSFARPSPDTIARFVDTQRTLSFTYDEVGDSRDRDPVGYSNDHVRKEIGRGADRFAAARDAIRAWKMFPAWTSIVPHAPIEADQTVAVLVHALGVWWLNAARIVYVIDEPRRFGFAYGTLPGHAESGEERFSVEHDGDDTVWYDLKAFSRPRYWAARIAYPLTRMLQRRFQRDSCV